MCTFSAIKLLTKSTHSHVIELSILDPIHATLLQLNGLIACPCDIVTVKLLVSNYYSPVVIPSCYRWLFCSSRCWLLRVVCDGLFDRFVDGWFDGLIHGSFDGFVVGLVIDSLMALS